MKNLTTNFKILLLAFSTMITTNIYSSDYNTQADGIGEPLRISQLRNLLQVVKETDLSIESWMTDRTYLDSSLKNFVAEPELEIETWMALPFDMSVTQGPENEMQVEDWMTRPIELNDFNVPERELQIETWMTTPEYIPLEPELSVEIWMTESL
jgi:hypothetical protein